jgi:adenylate kinase
VLLGKQGAGKGTQATRLAEHYGVIDVATGDLFRAAAREGTTFGIEAQRYMEKGELVPDEITVGVVEEILGRDQVIQHGFVLDGFPRTVRQAEELERVLGEHSLDLVIDLDVPTEIVVRRIAGRRVCINCGATYHVDNPPKVDWKCDVCGGEVLQRDDDTEEAVMRRLELYEIRTLPLIQFYRRKGTLAHVDGTGESDDVFQALISTVSDRFSADPDPS